MRLKDRLTVSPKRTGVIAGAIGVALAGASVLYLNTPSQEERFKANVKAMEAEAAKQEAKKDAVEKRAKPRAVAPAVRPLQRGGAEPAPVFPKSSPH